MGPRFSYAVKGPSLWFWLLTAFMCVLWIAGGASRADAFGQPVVRFCAWAILVAVVLFAMSLRRLVMTAPMLILLSAVLVAVLQLLPLPPGIWSALPGRKPITLTAEVVGLEQPWRAISLSPQATVNALGSLVVPVAVLLLANLANSRNQWRLLSVVLCLALAGALLALLQFAGLGWDNPFTNDVAGAASGNLANRNHSALMFAIGILLATAWPFAGKNRKKKLGFSLIFIFVFVMAILATGSRMGLVLGILALGSSLLIIRKSALLVLRDYSPKVVKAGAAAVVLFLVGIVAATVAYDRSDAIDRALLLQSEGDLRSRIWPEVGEMIATYFPVGSGVGAFDPAFRVAEKRSELALQYINHAHNDFLEIVLDTGVAGAALLIAALIWFARASFRAWRRSVHLDSQSRMLRRIGSMLIALVLVASVTDYPARTPMIMALLALGACWLAATYADKEATLR